MLVQPRRDGLRLIRQHDHALAAGSLASAWRGAGDEPRRLAFRTVLATALHDLAWRELDAAPRWNEATGRPFAFHGHPLHEKLAAYGRGLNRMEEISPWIGLAGSLHYASFLEGGGAEEAEDFLAAEEERQERLAGRLRERAAERPDARAGDRPDDPVAEVRRELRWLKTFDALSIRLCLTPPAVPDGELPPWLDRDEPLEAPDGTRLELGWEDEGAARIAPWPFDRSLALEVPVRDLAAPSYPDAGALRRAWEEADERLWRLELLPAD